MAYTPISGYTLQTITQGGEVASGYYLKFYEANTTTPLSMATDSSGGTLLVKAKLNDNGMPISNPLDNSTVFIPHLPSQYRTVIYTTEADADANNTASSFVNIASTPVSPTAESIQYSGGYFTYGGTANAITLTSPSELPSRTLQTGDKITFKATSANTSSTTITIDGGSTITCKTPTGVNLPSGFIRTDVFTDAVYDGANFVVSRKVESGSNANGDWTKLENGELECTRQSATSYTTSSASGVLFFNNGETFTYPLAFISTPVVTPSNKGGSGNAAIGNYTFSVTSTTARIGGFGVTNTDTFSPGYIAKGKWY